MIKFTTKLFLILAATLLPTGVWGGTVYSLPAAVNGVKTLADNTTYYIGNDTHFNDGYLYIPFGSTVTIQIYSNCSLWRSLSSYTEDGFVIKNEGTLNITGNLNYPTISGGKNSGNGGCIYNSGELNIQRTKIESCRTEGNGGAIYNTSSGIVTLLDCRIGYSSYYNSAVNGAGVYNEGELIIEGGQFNGNTASGQGGAIYQAGGTLTIKSSPVIATNKVGDVINNVYLPTGKTIAIDGVLGSGANIGITVETRGTFTTGSTSASNVSKFFSDIVGVDIVDAGDNNAKIQTQWDELQELLTAAESSGTLQLTRDYTAVAGVDVPLTFTGNVTIDLNGHTIDRGLSSSSAAADGFLVSVASGSSLTINDTGSGGTITGGNVNGNGGAIINAGTLTVSGGTITGNSATGNGGAVFNTGTVTISGGTLSSNSASQGGAIYNNGTLTISSGAIQYNTASTNGGGIYHYNGTLNMSGAPTISGNQKGTADNNVYLASGKTITVNADLTNTTAIGITMAANTGEFTTGLGSYTGDYQNFTSDDNRFLSSASGSETKLQTYWMDLQEKLTAGDVTLTRNYEYLSGFDNAGLTVSENRTLNLGSYKIDRKLSTATENGYVIKVTGGTLTVTGTGQITGGNNSGNGGGILVDGGTLVLSGGKITGNTAALGGGVYNGGTLQMSGAPIVTGNTGGNVYLPDGHSTITLVGTMNGSDGNIGITMQTPGVFTSGMNTYGTTSKFASDNGDYEVAPNGDEATLLSHWAALKATLAKGGTVNLTRDYVAPADGEYLEVPNAKTVTLDLKGHTINRNLTEATADGYVIKVIAGGTLTISDSGTGGTITGGNNSSNADGQRGGGICNLGTVNLQGGVISGNLSVSGGGIYNENTLNISGGTIASNTATTGGGIYNNGATFTMSGAPNIFGNTGGNTYLPTAHSTIAISAALSNTTAIGITMETNGVFTSGLNGKGNATNFASDNSSYGIALNNAGNAIIGTKYTITRDEPNDTYTYMYINGDYTSPTIEAVAGEYVEVTISGDGTYHTIPVSLSYTDGTLSTYPKGGEEYGFNMPDHDVTVTGLCLKGGYCGNANDEDIKYYLDGTTLRFQAKDASSYQMKNYVQNTVPWRDTSTYPYTSVYIPSNITNISNYAFYGSGLASIYVPASVATIGTKAFGFCPYLTAITVDGENTNYKDVDGVLFSKDGTTLYCYPRGKGDASYTIPAGVTTIAEEAFYYNPHLTTIPTSSVTTVGNYAFKGCTHLSSVTLTGIATIGEAVFSGCSSLATLNITGDGSLNIPNNYFYHNTYLQTVSLVNVATIGPSAFNGCSHLTSLTINGTTTIGQQAFSQCTTLSTISLAGVTTISASAFNNCSTLTSITIPSSVTSIDDNAFCWCSGLTTFHIPESVTTFGAGVFMYCQNLESITVHDDNPNYTADDGILYDKSKTKLICYPLAKEGDTYYVPTTVTQFDYNVFLWQTTLKKIIFLHDNSTYPIPSSGGFMSDSESYKAFVKKGLKTTYTTAWGASYSDRIFELDLEQATIEITGYDTYSDGVKYTDYDGNPKTPSVTVTLGGLPLKLKDNPSDPYDYEITSYSNNTAIGTATVNITGHGDFAGTTGAKDFYITRKIVISGATGHYSTYYNFDAVPLTRPSGLRAYKVTGVDFGEGSTTIEEIDYLPAGTPVLLYKSDGYCNGTYHLKATTGDVPSYSANYIGKGENDARDYESLMAGKTAIYVLRGDKFYRAYSGTLPANRCYIANPTAGARAIPDYLEIGEGDGTTGLKSIENGELKIENDNYYDLSGRRVLYPTKGGIYIYNGKKIVIK